MTQEELKQWLNYDPDTGIFVWLNASAYQQRLIGDQAGSIQDNGYRYIMVCGKLYKSSRLAWFYMTGEWPEKLVDHKDKDRLNDKWDNLRPATHSENNCNRSVQTNNTSGVTGVSYSDRDGKWIADISKHGKRHRMYHDSFEEAVAWRNMMEEKIHGEFASRYAQNNRRL